MTVEEINDFIAEKIAPEHIHGDFVHNLSLLVRLIEYLEKNRKRGGFSIGQMLVEYHGYEWKCCFMQTYEGQMVTGYIGESIILSHAMSEALIKKYKHDVERIKRWIEYNETHNDDDNTYLKEQLQIIESGEKNREKEIGNER
jgi:hypothetical protein